MTEYLVQHKRSPSWSSISIPATGDALVVGVVDGVNDYPVSSTLNNATARELIDWLRDNRADDYTVTIVD